MTVIDLHTRCAYAQALPVHKPYYELFWMKGPHPLSVGSCDRSRIERQMRSLAGRGISAAVYEDGFPAGYVGPGPRSRNGGGFEVVLFEERHATHSNA